MEATEGEAPDVHRDAPDVNCNNEKESAADDAQAAKSANKSEALAGDNNVMEPMEIDPPEETDGDDLPPILEREIESPRKGSPPPKRSGSESGDLEVRNCEQELQGNAAAEDGVEGAEGGASEGGEDGERKAKELVKGASARKRKVSEIRSLEERSSEGPPMKDKPRTDSRTDERITDESSTSELSSDLTLPPKQLLGKGKRARIPNKRYSDFPLAASKHEHDEENGRHAKSFENGEMREMPVLDAERPLSEEPIVTAPQPPAITTPVVAALKGGGRGSQSNSPASSRKKPPVDVSNPLYLIPFEQGWKREFVYRSSGDPSLKRTGDIYYYTPAGKKLRSMRELTEGLKDTDLTVDHFTFARESLGLNDPEKEIVREAKMKNSLSASARKSRLSRSLKLTSPKGGATTKGEAAETPEASTSSRGRAAARSASFKVKIQQRPKPRSLRLVERSKKQEDTENPYAPVYKTSSKKATPKTGATVNSTNHVRQAEDLQMTDKSDTPPPSRPQFVEMIGNRKYLVIPKHHVISAATTPSTPLSRPSHPDTVHNATRIGEESWAGPLASSLTPASASLGPGSAASAQVPPTDHLHHHQPATDNGACTEAANAARTPNKTLQLIDPAKSRFMDNYLQNVAYGYNTLLYVFQYLKVQDLLSASCVCTMWRDIAAHPSLWTTVRMKNSQIHSFTGLAEALDKHGTVHLDLRKMLLPNNGGASGDEIWGQFSRAIKKVTSLRKIELCRCPAVVIEQLPLSNPQLEVINAVAIKCEKIGLSPLVFLTQLRELRLKSTSGFTLKSDLSALSELKQLKHLSLTSVKDLHKQNVEVLSDLRNLESLDLGECTDFPKSFGNEILTRLNKLERLRLEKGQGECHTFEILEAVRHMPYLEQLELINFDIKPGFDKALGLCKNIKKLLIIPTYISQSATTNHMVLSGVLRLQSTLTHFVWGVTLELLRVTELFVDQCEDAERKDARRERRAAGTNESIPVLKPVPVMGGDDGGSGEIPPAQDPPQVEILPLPNLQKLLLQSLPTTRVKLLKIPFHATWRQTVTDI